MTIGTEHRIAVDLDRREDGTEVWRTGKPEYRVKRGDRLVFQTNGVAARVWIPDPEIIDGGSVLLEIDAESGWTAEAVVNEKLQIDGPLSTDFGFYLVEERKLAEGNSPPSMIVEP